MNEQSKGTSNGIPDSSLAVTLTVGQLRELVQTEVQAAMAQNGHHGEDRLLDAEEAAKMLSTSPGWLYKNHSKLPFTVKLHHKMLRFSYQGIQRYMAAKKIKARS